MTDGTNEQAASAVADLAPADEARATLSPFQTHPGDRVCRVVEVYSNRWEGKRPGIVVNTPLPLDPNTKPDVYVNVFLDGTRDNCVLHAWRGRPEGNTVRVLALAQHDDLVALPAEGDWYVARMPFIPPSPLVDQINGLKIMMNAHSTQIDELRKLTDNAGRDTKLTADAQDATRKVLEGLENRLSKAEDALREHVQNFAIVNATLETQVPMLVEIKTTVTRANEQIQQMLGDKQAVRILTAGTVDKPATPDALAKDDATANETATELRAKKAGTPPDDRSGPQEGDQ